MKMAFPGSKNMADAMTQMQAMMGGMKGRPGMGAGQAGGANLNAQMKMAMDLLQQMQGPKGGQRKR